MKCTVTLDSIVCQLLAKTNGQFWKHHTEGDKSILSTQNSKLKE